MTDFSCFIVDDHRSIVELLSGYVIKTKGLVLAGSETDPFAARDALLSGNIEATITFLDIEMPGISGIELARAIKPFTNIIFTTAHRDFGPEAFEHDALDYLLKPVSYEKFIRAVNKARISIDKNTKYQESVPFIFVPGDGRSAWNRINPADILYVKADSNYIHIFTDTKEIMSYTSLEKLLENLPDKYFVRIHKSFIVNLSAVNEVNPNDVVLLDGKEIPIGRTYKEGLLKKIKGTKEA